MSITPVLRKFITVVLSTNQFVIFCLYSEIFRMKALKMNVILERH